MRAPLRGRPAFWAVLIVVLVGLFDGPAVRGQSSRSDSARSPASIRSAPEAGPWPQRYVGPDAYDAHKQNWDAAQDTSGTFYVANTDGVLVYDGHTWRTILPANRSLVRSVAADEHGRVFVGAKREFGVLRRDSTGRRHYVSLLDHVPEAHRSFTDVWRTETTSEGVYFHTYRRVFRWDPEAQSMRSWAPPEGTEFNQGGAARDTFFAGVPGRGLMAVQDDSLRLVPGGEELADRSVIFVRPHPRHGLVVGTYDGLFVREERSFRRLQTDVPDLIRSAWIHRATVLPDGTIAIATVDVGLLLFAPDGTLRRRLTPREAAVSGVYADREGGLWALLDGGLVRYDRGAPFTEYGARIGLEGTVTDVARHQGALYVSTLQNLYRRRVSADTLAMVPERGINTQSWTLLSVGEDLLVGTVRGLNRIGPDGTVRRLFDVDHVYGTLRSREDSARVYAATGRGVRLVRRTDEGWSVGPQVPGLDTEARTLAEADDGTLWVGTAFDGVYRVRLGDPLDSTTVDHFGSEHGLPSDRVDPQRWNDELVFGTSTGLMRFAEAPSPHFEPMSTVEMPPLRSNEGVVRLKTVGEDVAWGITGWGPGRWVRRDTTWRWAPGPLHRLRDREMQVLQAEEEGRRLWIGTEEGLLRYTPGTERSGSPPAVRLREARVFGTDSLLAVRGTADRALALSYADNGVRLAYGTPSLAHPAGIEYQYRLSNRSEEWSDWTPRTERELPNLSPGPVTVSVRARTAYGDTTRTAQYSFTVLPPWYRTWWAYGLYGLLALGLVGGAVQWRTRRLRRRQEELEETVAERTEEIQRKNERLRELDEAKSRFFANITHEFRTPLTLIRGPMQEVRAALERGTLEPSEGAEQLALAERNTARLQRLVDQLLGLARMDAGTYEITARATDLGAEATRVVRTFEPFAERQGLTLTVAVEQQDNGDPVYVDREALEHILENLLSNAIKFTPADGRVEVRVTERADAVDLSVRDTGPGIPEEKQAVVFDRFRQVDDSTTREQEGAGIGLAFAKDLVDLHGGTITLDSAEGEGTTITLRLPRGRAPLPDDQLADSRPSEEVESTEPPEDDRTSSSASSRSILESRSTSPSERGTTPSAARPPVDQSQTDSNDHSKLVLVVDDNADVRRYVRSVLAPDYAVIAAADGAEGLDAAREQLPDVILADVMMPSVDGHEMTRRLKDDPETEAIPVIMVTARAETSDEVTGLEVGADDYVTKPFDADVLRARVDGMISVQERLRRRIREELRRRSGDGQAGDGTSDDDRGGDRAPDAAPPELVVPTASNEEPAFVREVRAAVEDRLADPDLDVEQLASAVAVSRSTLYRRLKDQADIPPSAFIQQVRIEHGARLLREREGTVSEVAYAVGFSSLSYFSRSFREHVGQSPSEYAEATG